MFVDIMILNVPSTVWFILHGTKSCSIWNVLPPYETVGTSCTKSVHLTWISEIFKKPKKKGTGC